MATLLFSLAVILASMAGLAVGVLLKGEPLHGTCGGARCAKHMSCAACHGADVADTA